MTKGVTVKRASNYNLMTQVWEGLHNVSIKHVPHCRNCEKKLRCFIITSNYQQMWLANESTSFVVSSIIEVSMNK